MGTPFCDWVLSGKNQILENLKSTRFRYLEQYWRRWCSPLAFWSHFMNIMNISFICNSRDGFELFKAVSCCFWLFFFAFIASCVPIFFYRKCAKCTDTVIIFEKPTCTKSCRWWQKAPKWATSDFWTKLQRSNQRLGNRNASGCNWFL